jgi:hypothetical protein
MALPFLWPIGFAIYLAMRETYQIFQNNIDMICIKKRLISLKGELAD